MERIIGLFKSVYKRYCSFYRTRKKRVNVREQNIFVGLRSEIDLIRVKTYSDKEPETLNWIDSFAEDPIITYFDVGANIGVYSLYPAKKYGKKIRVYSFEPMSQNLSSLNNNIYINNLSGIIKPYCVAISEKSGFKELYVPSNRMRSGGNRSQFGENVDDAAKVAGKRIVHTEGAFGVSMDDLCDKFGFPVPNYIKIDVDGIELQILKGATNVLKDKNLKSILIELGNIPHDEHEESRNILENNGFKRIFHGTQNEIYERL